MEGIYSKDSFVGIDGILDTKHWYTSLWWITGTTITRIYHLPCEEWRSCRHCVELFDRTYMGSLSGWLWSGGSAFRFLSKILLQGKTTKPRANISYRTLNIVSKKLMPLSTLLNSNLDFLIKFYHKEVREASFILESTDICTIRVTQCGETAI